MEAYGIVVVRECVQAPRTQQKRNTELSRIAVIESSL
jgi:hypothetical protein